MVDYQELASKITLELCEKREVHGRLVFRWRVDPVTREMSFSSENFTWADFYPRFLERYYLVPDLPPLFASVGGQKVAFISFCPYPAESHACEIAIMVDPALRGQGLGTAFLIKIKDFLRQQGYEEVYARIKPHNQASLRAFQNAGFTKVKDGSAPRWSNGVEEMVHFEVYKMDLLSFKKGPLFIIAEVGSNWRVSQDPFKDLQVAKELIYKAKEAGCDAVKFQTFTPESLYVPNPGKSNYLAASGMNEDIQTLLQKVSMPHEVIPILHGYCKEAGIEFMSTPFSPKDFEAVDPYVVRHKIASYEINHLRLLELAGRSKKPIILSTGASTIEDIALAIDIITLVGGKDLTLLQCTAKYPAELDSLHLRVIPWMRTYFGYPVGLSDHSEDPLIAPLAAAALGAKVIEKHFTLDKKLPGPDHRHSITPHELRAMVTALRGVEKALGNAIKEVIPQEKELFSFARRSLQAMRFIKKGEVFKENENVAILRPGNQKAGVHPCFVVEVQGRESLRDISAGDGIQMGDWERGRKI